MAATALCIPAEVLLSQVPALLDIQDIKNLAHACDEWAAHQEHMLRQHALESFFQAWPQLECYRPMVNALPRDDILYVTEILKELKEVEPNQGYWMFPADWLEVILKEKEEVSDTKQLEIIETVSLYTYNSSFGRRLPNKSIYCNKYMSRVVTELSCLLLESMGNNDPTHVDEIYQNMSSQNHLKYRGKYRGKCASCTCSQDEFWVTMKWARRLYDVCRRYTLIHVAPLDIAAVHTNPPAYLMCMVLTDLMNLITFCPNGKTYRWLRRREDAREFIDYAINGGLMVDVVNYDDVELSAQDEWLVETSERLYYDMEEIKTDARVYNARYYQSLPDWF